MLIRLAQSGDVNGILALYRELRPGDPELPEPKASLRKILSNPDLALIVCECDDALTATCMLALVPNLASGGRPFGVLEHVVFQSGLMQAVLARDSSGGLIRKTGIMGIVLVGGEVAVDDRIEIELPPPPHRQLDRV